MIESQIYGSNVINIFFLQKKNGSQFRLRLFFSEENVKMRRFASVTEEVNVLLYNRSSEKTKNSTKAAVACFREFLRSEAADDQFETFAESTLASYI